MANLELRGPEHDSWNPVWSTSATRKGSEEFTPAMQKGIDGCLSRLPKNLTKALPPSLARMQSNCKVSFRGDKPYSKHSIVPHLALLPLELAFTRLLLNTLDTQDGPSRHVGGGHRSLHSLIFRSLAVVLNVKSWGG